MPRDVQAGEAADLLLANGRCLFVRFAIHNPPERGRHQIIVGRAIARKADVPPLGRTGETGRWRRINFHGLTLLQEIEGKSLPLSYYVDQTIFISSDSNVKII